MSFFKKIKRDVEIEQDIEESEDKAEIERESRISAQDEEKEANQKEKKGKLGLKKVSIAASKKAAPDWLKANGQLAVDVYQTDSDFCVQAPIAGVESKDIDISLENEMLVIKGERKEPEQDKVEEHLYQECYWGPFLRQIILPEDVDVQRIKASLHKGILIVKIPRRKTHKKKVIIEIEE